ncbi:MAG: bifunctional folylpolyglutamate synthase/dihydrofolate synthase [Planctomycetes bacterium]|nr:bifunctional folylpolyglutamate synthase/dihydrofolate synthase [Planctomycetota bacterium]
MTSSRLAEALARLDALVNWERRDRDASMRRGLEPIQGLLARMGNPERSFRAVHITGTKGKGTTSALIEAGLRRAGLATGLYTSPHVERVNERVRVRGAEVGDEELAFALETALEARASAPPGSQAGESTWFDLVTAAAFLVFARAKIEWAVVEVGLGGRLDSTNVVRGEVCVITNIDLEHTAVLGNSRREIAREKAGILKPGSTLVTGVRAGEAPPEDDPAVVIEREAAGLEVRTLRPQVSDPGASAFERNTALACLVLDELGRRGLTRASAAGVSERAPVSAALLDAQTLASARLPGRAERRRVGATAVVLDAAHVASSVSLLLAELSREREFLSPPVVLLALGRDKDARSILKALESRVDRVVCTTVASGPLRDAETLAQEARTLGIVAETAADPERGLARALDLTAKGGWVLVLGSFYLVGALRPRTSPLQPAPPTEASRRC